ncbi:37S ribosomal protein S25, mitochondrial [Psilocybe cubensis]|uniref:Small ribosomal subunit protein mS23 n=2 Tax=Psilocybe cubensis TaxID=181762 RepID=A0A8H8CRC7_PSICU|nr:37S ribosomal protein S25, mitochondrial [Psilocybe cubensis]KAH9486580.1 37S ribosomal protein S25, mitochondrial [Psilocybe cubensis]
MGRRIASQVHQQVSRLLRANYIQKEPVWFQAVLDHPPLTLPPKAPPPRTPYDQRPTKKLSKYTTRPQPIFYLEDYLRRRFFTDHPFETFRPATLIETDRIQDPNFITGEAWTRLRQWGRNPAPEDAIRFALNLYQYHNVTLNEAYSRAVAQFRTLRSEHHVASRIAVLEAEQLGSTFGPSHIEESFVRQKQSLATWDRKEELDEGSLAAQKRWKAIVNRNHGAGQWSEGKDYARLWQQGIKPNYMPALVRSVAPTTTKIDKHDPMGLKNSI